MAEVPLHDVVVVGAGPAGLGVAATLRRLGVDAVVVDRHGIGASFLRWPDGMRLITPSFPGNQFGAVDLNAITPDTSPALSLLEEHPTGEAYARYLQLVAELEELDVREGVEVSGVHAGENGDLVLEVLGQQPWRARAVVWAAGESQYPRHADLPGTELGTATITVRCWDDVPGDDLVVVGGYESGIDAAVNLVARGRDVTVIDRDAPWETLDADPSRSLSPYTHARLRSAYSAGSLRLLGDTTVTRLTRSDAGVTVHTADGGSLRSDGPPLLATGFEGSLGLVRDHFAFDDDGRVELTEHADESTVMPGLFLAGPMLAHREAIFCFIYKFRQRFAVVARGVAERLGVDAAPLDELREHGFYLDDLACCEDACAC